VLHYFGALSKIFLFIVALQFDDKYTMPRDVHINSFIVYSYLWTYDFYTAPYVMVLIRADPIRGQVGGGWALESRVRTEQ
jgi:hypothetical protein